MNMRKFLRTSFLIVTIFLFIGSTSVYAGTLDPFSYSAGSYLAGDTTDYTFTFTTETADPNMIFRALWSNNSGISLSEDVPTVTIDGVAKIPSEYWWGGGTIHNPYIRMGIAIPAGSEIVIVIPNVTNGGAGTYSWANDIFTADAGANAIDRPASIASLTLVSDVTAPTVDTLSPADNATGVAVDANLVITFDETVDAETGNITLKKTSDDTTVETFDVTSDISGSGSDTITINPTSDLDSETEYYVQVDATAFDDTAGNSYAGISDTTTWSFTTADVDNPTVGTLSPADNATDVALDSSLVITFAEVVDVESGNITIYKASDNSQVEVIDVTSGQVTGTGTTEVTVNPLNNFEYETEYYVQIDATAFDDTAGNSYAGISDTTTWSFTTVDAPVVETSTENLPGQHRRVSVSKNSQRTTFDVVEQYRTVFMQLYNSGIQLPQNVIDILNIETPKKTMAVQDLEYDMKGDDVVALQKILINQGYSIAAGATGYFGLQTQYALDAYQVDNSIAPRGGYFGPITRAQMKSAGLDGLWW